MSKQIHIFLENKPGRLSTITDILLNAKINIIAFTIQDRGDFGLMKLLVDDHEKAYLALADKNFACVQKEVLAMSIKDKMGNLHKLTLALSKHNINIIDAHGFVTELYKKGICAIELAEKDLKKAEKILKKEGFEILGDNILA